jgi:predicted dehydrogenase
LSKSFAWGIVGTGAIARQFVADLQFVPDARAAVVCSRGKDTAVAFQQALGVERASIDLEALCNDPEVDALYIATPNSLHAEQAGLAIAHGKPVLVEKPLATSASDARSIEAAAAARGSFAMEAMWTRFLPAVRQVRALVEEGRIGRIREIRAELSYFHPETEASRLFRPDLGGGAALDLGVYPLSLALHLLGRPARVGGRRQMSRLGVDLRTEFHLVFDRAEAFLSCGFDREGQNQFVITGTDGVLVLDAPFLKAQRIIRCTHRAYRLMAATGSGLGHRATARLARTLRLPGLSVSRFDFPGNGLQFEAAAVMEAVRGGATQSEIMPLAHSVAVLEAIEAVA